MRHVPLCRSTGNMNAVHLTSFLFPFSTLFCVRTAGHPYTPAAGNERGDPAHSLSGKKIDILFFPSFLRAARLSIDLVIFLE